MELEEISEGIDTLNKNVLNYKSESKTDADNIRKQVKEIGESVDAMKKKAGKLGGGGYYETPSLKSVIADLFAQNASALPGIDMRDGWKVENKTFTLSGNLTGSGFVTAINQVPIRPYYRRHMRDIVSVTNTATGLLSYPQELSSFSTGSMGYQIPAATKANIDYKVKMVPMTLQYLAGVTQVDRGALTDLPFLQSMISSYLSEDLFQKEDSYYVAALIAAAQAGTTSETQSLAMMLDYIAQAEQSGHLVDTILCAPSAWAKILKTRSNQMEFTSIPGAQTDNAGNVTIAGYPVVKIPAMPANQVLVGAFQTASTIFQAEGVSIRTSEYDATNFQQNLFTFRAEVRSGLGVLSPYSFYYGAV